MANRAFFCKKLIYTPLISRMIAKMVQLPPADTDAIAVDNSSQSRWQTDGPIWNSPTI